MWPSHIPVDYARISGRMLTVASKPMLQEYPARIFLIVTYGEKVPVMRQMIPGIVDRSWDIDESDMRKAIERQWSGVSLNITPLD